jgi:hypothetical protein
LEAGWSIIQTKLVTPLEEYLETDQKKKFVLAVNEYSEVYTTVCNMASQKPPHNYCAELYRRFCSTVKDHVDRQATALEKLSGRPLLLEMERRWNNHNVYVAWLLRGFTYLDRCYVRLRTASWLGVSTGSLLQDGRLVFLSAVEMLLEPLMEAASNHRGVDLCESMKQMHLDLLSIRPSNRRGLRPEVTLNLRERWDHARRRGLRHVVMWVCRARCVQGAWLGRILIAFLD